MRPGEDQALVLLANCYLDRGANHKALDAARLAAVANAKNGDAFPYAPRFRCVRTADGGSSARRTSSRRV
jgi:hypothetical protein